MDTTAVVTRNLIKEYKNGTESFRALDGVQLIIESGEFVGLVGPSGSGKTTFLNIVGALDSPTGGKAVVLGKDVNQLRHSEAAALRNTSLGFIFQTYNLLPVYSVYENVEFPLLLLKVPKPERERRVKQALEWLGLETKARSRPSQISGGECQRVAVARAMVKNPRIVLADEPTANLDAANSHHIIRTMLSLNRDLGTTFIFATHDQKVIEYLHRKIVLNDGKVVDDIRVQEKEVP